MKTQSNKKNNADDKDPLQERAVEKGSGRHSTLQGQTSIHTVSKATLGGLLRDGAEAWEDY